MAIYGVVKVANLRSLVAAGFPVVFVFSGLFRTL